MCYIQSLPLTQIITNVCVSMVSGVCVATWQVISDVRYELAKPLAYELNAFGLCLTMESYHI
jgi:ABC-type thiamin/hydroxymethylpyrimidine transport system permease subunit